MYMDVFDCVLSLKRLSVFITGFKRLSFMIKHCPMTALLLIGSLAFVTPLSAHETANHEKYIQAYEVGIMVQQLQLALESPEDGQSLITINHYGTDSRYYAMIRGWLFQELVASESQLNASQSQPYLAKFQQKSDFLKQAIRMIDLE